MDASDATKVVIDKITRLEPEHVVKKIIGYMYFQAFSDEEMIRLAMGPESFIHGLIQNAKTARLSPPMNSSPALDLTCQFSPFTVPSPHPLPDLPISGRFHPYLDPQLRVERHQMRHPLTWHTGLEDRAEGIQPAASAFQNNYHCREAALHPLRGSRTLMSVMDSTVKTCHYFIKGYCKHGNSCRYVHGEPPQENYSHTFGCNPYDTVGEDQAFLPGSLEKLEMEIVELLKSRRGNPVSIASLPMMYYEKYSKTLQAEGYLTESQRHGKAGYSLTKLLARLKNSIRLIDRPHGQHAVVLVEDAPKHIDIRSARNEPGHVASSSCQIYLTFPAESTFTEEDVSNYFNTFGLVQDVRIPCQQKRMFGFVTFVSAGTVKLILSRGNPHYICGARVLVKPYREKSKLVERKYQENYGSQLYHNAHPIEIEAELQARWESSGLFRRQLTEEYEQALQLERMRLSQLCLPCRSVANLPCFGHSMPEDGSSFPSTTSFNYMLDVLTSRLTGDDDPKSSINNSADQQSSEVLNLPDSPFAAAVASSIAAIL